MRVSREGGGGTNELLSVGLQPGAWNSKFALIWLKLVGLVSLNLVVRLGFELKLPLIGGE